MADDFHKDKLTARLSTLRAQLTADLTALRQSLDVPAQMKSSYGRHRAAWLGGAAAAGWVLARLPARKKKVKVYVDRKDERKLKEATEAGLVLALSKMLFSALRPAVTAFAAKKITDYVTRDGASKQKTKGG